MDKTDSTAASPSPTGRLKFSKRRRFWLLAVLGLVAVMVFFLPFLSLIFGTRLKVENYDQIQEFMTQAQVEAPLGGGPGYYRCTSGGFQRVAGRYYGSNSHPPPWASHQSLAWLGEDTWITVYFDGNGRARFKELRPDPRLRSKNWGVYWKDWYKDWLVAYWPGSARWI